MLNLDINERSFAEAVESQLGRRHTPATQQGHHVDSVAAYDRSNLIAGDVYNYGVLFGQSQESDEIKSFGLCLAAAPLIDTSDFVGRVDELNQMKDFLRPGEMVTEQRRLVLGGMGGIGKTQLAIAYARLHPASYKSIFWVNATTELTLKESFRTIIRQLLQLAGLEKLGNEQVVPRVLNWFADTRNTQWLLIFDNYDEPDQFAIDDYVPHAAHGSIVITTRLPDHVKGSCVRVQPFRDLEESLVTLQSRSGRGNVKNDLDACRLAERLEGLPLALVTAGAYLRKTTLTFGQYLEAYEHRFNVNPRRPVQLQEYQDRTLYTTWNLSYSRLESEDPLAANTLKLLAYFDNQEIWFELLHAGLTDELPLWLQELTGNRIEFESAMGTLVEYCLLEVHATTSSYSMHSCVHDWTLAELNKVVNAQLYRYAFDCIARLIDPQCCELLGHVRYARLASRAARLTHNRFVQHGEVGDITYDWIDSAVRVGQLLQQQAILTGAEVIYRRSLVACKNILGPEHTMTLQAFNNLGLLYREQGKPAESEEMFRRALARYEEGRMVDLILTISTINNLANLLLDQGKVDRAEAMFKRAMSMSRTIYGSYHTSTLQVVNNLGLLYRSQGVFDKAQELLEEAFTGKKTTFGSNHPSTLDSARNLGLLYLDQSNLDDADQLFQEALAGYESILGPNHRSCFETLSNLGTLNARRGRLEEAERNFRQALAGKEKVLGHDHLSTIDTMHNLGLLYRACGNRDKAKEVCQKVFVSYEKIHGSTHMSTLMALNNLAALCAEQGELEEAEQIFERVLTKRDTMPESRHRLTLDLIYNLGVLYGQQGKLWKAAQMFTRALRGYETVLGDKHASTLNTLHNLKVVNSAQRKVDEAGDFSSWRMVPNRRGSNSKHVLDLSPSNDFGLAFSRCPRKLKVPEHGYLMTIAAAIGWVSRN